MRCRVLTWPWRSGWWPKRGSGFHRPRIPKPIGDFFREAAASSPDAAAKLQWLQEQGAPLADETEMQSLLFREALEAGQVTALRRVLSAWGTTLGQLIAAGRLSYQHEHAAIRSGSLPMLEYLRKEGFGFAGWAEPCARAGNVALARWLVREAHVPINRSGLQYVLQSWPDGLPAHSRGLLEVAQLLVGEAECRDWDAERTLCTAARRGDLALVQYLLQQRPEYQPRGKVLVAASDSGCEALLELLVEQHPSCRDTGRDSAYYAALRTGDLGTLAALRWLGVPWDAPDILLGALGSPVESPVLRWLVEQGAPVGSNNRNDKRRAAAFLRGGRLDPSVTAVLEAWVGQS